jgi:hypothetical protein
LKRKHSLKIFKNAKEQPPVAVYLSDIHFEKSGFKICRSSGTEIIQNQNLYNIVIISFGFFVGSVVRNIEVKEEFAASISRAEGS